MNRNTVMIDGTKPGSPRVQPPPKPTRPSGSAGRRTFDGNNGVVVYKASGVTLQNFSTCNFLGSNAGGDSVWFDGGGATGKQEIGSWAGEYLSSTSTYWGGMEKPSDEYGIYASNTTAPASSSTPTPTTCPTRATTSAPARTATRRSTNATAEGNDLGYSGSNSGGHVVIENSEFKNNEEGVATQSQNNDDAPSPAGRDAARKAKRTRARPRAPSARTSAG